MRDYCVPPEEVATGILHPESGVQALIGLMEGASPRAIWQRVVRRARRQERRAAAQLELCKRKHTRELAAIAQRVNEGQADWMALWRAMGGRKGSPAMDGMRVLDDPQGEWVNASDEAFCEVSARIGEKTVQSFKAGCVIEAATNLPAQWDGEARGPTYGGRAAQAANFALRSERRRSGPALTRKGATRGFGSGRGRAHGWPVLRQRQGWATLSSASGDARTWGDSCGNGGRLRGTRGSGARRVTRAQRGETVTTGSEETALGTRSSHRRRARG